MTKLALEFPGGDKIDEDLNLLISPSPGASGWKFGSTTTPAKIINNLIPIIFILAGIVLLAMLVSGGFTIFLSAGNPEKIKKGTSMITSALVGFLIIFAAYWILELLQISFGIKVL